MSDLGLGAYRFSISWPRILPLGEGPVNEAGLDFYDRLVDALLEAGIAPFVTLYHWDLPSALQDKGGWADRGSVDRFTRYAEVVFDRLGDRVKRWITINEPFCVVEGYIFGHLAPGLGDLRAGLRTAHHLLLAHGRTVRRFRELGKGGDIGIAINLCSQQPATDKEEDRKAARRADAYWNHLYTDPLFKGSHPGILPEWFGSDWPEIPKEDLAEIATPMDFLGLNYYTRQKVAHEPGAGVTDAKPVPQKGRRTAMGWEVYPEGLHELLCRIRDECGDIPVHITENGAAYHDEVDASGEVDDRDRIAYLREHLLQVLRALEDGVRVKGYFAWSLLDNFEWCHGYSKRFGLIRVDYGTQKRTVKKSGRWYRSVIAQNALRFES